PDDRGRHDQAVHRHRHLLRCLDRRHHRLGPLGLPHPRGRPHLPGGALPTGVAGGTSSISATSGLISGSTVLTVSASTLPPDYSSDSFGRTVAPGSWGTDAQGHSYVISGTVAASNAQVNGSAGLLTIPTRCDQM